MIQEVITNKIPLRIRIGVTGHRVLKEPEIIKSKVREILDSIIPKCFAPKILKEQSIEPLSFSVITMLAEGADRLIANEVLRIPGSEMEVVLPFNIADYMNDFVTAKSKTEFEGLLIKSKNIVTLEKHPPEDNPSLKLAGKIRDIQYKEGGHYVVNHCDLLVAIWDGKQSGGIGGTAEIIDYAREIKFPLIILFSEQPYEIISENF
jgi:hypothetical protein